MAIAKLTKAVSAAGNTSSLGNMVQKGALASRTRICERYHAAP